MFKLKMQSVIAVKISVYADYGSIFYKCINLKDLNYKSYTTYTIKYICNGNEMYSFKRFASIDTEITEEAEIFSGIIVDGPTRKTIKLSAGEKENIIYFNYREPKIFDVSFYDYYGKLIGISQVSEGEKIDFIDTIPTRDPDEKYTYTFEGWNINNKTGHFSDLIATPIFKKEVRKYLYSIVYRSGDVTLDREEGMAEYGSIITAALKKFKGYIINCDTFFKWNESFLKN